jgi:branched-chain amino acid transport system permease protein
VQRSGLYFIMLTFALNQLFYFVAYQWTSVTGGEDGMPGIPRPAFLGIDFGNPIAYYVFVSALFLLSLWIMKRIVESPLGKILQAIRENEVRAEAVGYDTARFKLAAFVIGGASRGWPGCSTRCSSASCRSSPSASCSPAMSSSPRSSAARAPSTGP